MKITQRWYIIHLLPGLLGGTVWHPSKSQFCSQPRLTEADSSSHSYEDEEDEGDRDTNVEVMALWYFLGVSQISNTGACSFKYGSLKFRAQHY